jgi:hypothetical protein
MPKSAAYVALQDEPVTLKSGSDVSHTMTFDLPNVVEEHESVLSFVADPFGDDTVSLEWDLNGINILTNAFDTAPSRALQEIVAKDRLKATGNTLEVRITDTDGSAAIKIDDVVLLYTHRI